MTTPFDVCIIDHQHFAEDADGQPEGRAEGVR
jgi:hypothetical protein